MSPRQGLVKAQLIPVGLRKLQTLMNSPSRKIFVKAPHHYPIPCLPNSVISSLPMVQPTSLACQETGEHPSPGIIATSHSNIALRTCCAQYLLLIVPTFYIHPEHLHRVLNHARKWPEGLFIWKKGDWILSEGLQ